MKPKAVLFLLLFSFVSVYSQRNMLSTNFTVQSPESVGLNSQKLAEIETMANNAIAAHAFPGCQVLVARNGKVVYYKTYGFLNYDSLEPVTPNTLYDLASMTKVSATLMAVMHLYEQKKFSLNATLGSYLPWVANSDKAALRMDDILLHQSGLLPDVFFYREAIDTATGTPLPSFFTEIPDALHSVRVADNLYLRNNWLDTMNLRIVQSPLVLPAKYVYSDLNFILLGKIVEQISGETLDKYVAENFYKPLTMNTTFIPRQKGVSIANIAPTEKEKLFRLQLLRGDVHDPSAAMYGGVAGHAGLFSNAYDLSKLYLMLLNGGEWEGKRYFQKQTIDLFTGYHSNISRRGYGWDKPLQDNATNNDPYPSKYSSPETFGHTGFTGTCVWADPKEKLLFIFLCNRVCPDGGANGLLGKLEVRRNMLDAVYKAIEK